MARKERKESSAPRASRRRVLSTVARAGTRRRITRFVSALSTAVDSLDALSLGDFESRLRGRDQAQRDGVRTGKSALGRRVRPNENANERFGQWSFEEQDLRTPFAPHTRRGYEELFDHPTAFGQHPAMTYGEDGDELTAETVADRTGVPVVGVR